MHAPDRAAAPPRRLGLTLALVSAFAFGGSGVMAKPLIEAGLAPLQVAWVRAAGAALVLLPLAWRHRRLVRERPALLLGFGMLGVAGVQACYFAAIARIPVGVALLIEYLAPALVLGWVRFVQRRPVSREAAVGVVTAVTGLVCVVELWAGLGFDALGVALALAAACCQVGYLVLSDHGSAGDHRPPPEPAGVIAYGLLVGALLLTVPARPWDMEWAVLGRYAAMDGFEVPGYALAAWTVLVATVLAYLTGVLSIRRLSPQVAGVIACLEAVVATVLAWFLLGERLGAVQVLGGALVLTGALIAQRTTPVHSAAEPVARGGGQRPGLSLPVGRTDLPDREGPPGALDPAGTPGPASRTGPSDSPSGGGS
ncbi:EamA family transporter [Streptomyces sp. P38-E01]|uniref:EamA family transporter n=1 Tax=Streptomyces tardus TaxID=2780544 RepID=A0A949JK07_9ACTN|nr:EamA family transporter [Streptomyces tardus]MBU7600120.1 EamA family transporter [Streptomyces tardus]